MLNGETTTSFGVAESKMDAQWRVETTAGINGKSVVENDVFCA